MNADTQPSDEEEQVEVEAPEFTNPPTQGKVYTVRVGDQYDDHFILEPTIEEDSIKVTLIVDGEKVDSQQCDLCPVTLSDRNIYDLLITARDVDFANRFVGESPLSGGKFQQTVQIPCSIELYSELSKLSTIYHFTVILTRETETTLYPDGQVVDPIVDETTDIIEDPVIDDDADEDEVPVDPEDT